MAMLALTSRINANANTFVGNEVKGRVTWSYKKTAHKSRHSIFRGARVVLNWNHN